MIRRVEGGDSDQLLKILPSQRQWTFLEQHCVPKQSVILDGPRESAETEASGNMKLWDAQQDRGPALHQV